MYREPRHVRSAYTSTCMHSIVLRFAANLPFASDSILTAAPTCILYAAPGHTLVVAAPVAAFVTVNMAELRRHICIITAVLLG